MNADERGYIQNHLDVMKTVLATLLSLPLSQ